MFTSSLILFKAVKCFQESFAHLCVDLISSLHFFKTESLPSVFTHRSSDTLQYHTVINKMSRMFRWNRVSSTEWYRWYFLQCLLHKARVSSSLLRVSVSSERRSNRHKTTEIISHMFTNTANTQKLDYFSDFTLREKR